MTKTFSNRIMVEAVMETLSPLHIGSGGTTTRADFEDETEKRKVDISAVCTDVHGRPYIPGSALKGSLRSWMTRRLGESNERLKRLFGSPDPKEKDATGSRLEFEDAFFLNLDLDFPEEEKRPPRWNEKRKTGVAANVKIDRATGTAEEKKLFHFEFVPPGARFGFILHGYNLEEFEIALLHGALKELENQFQLGSGLQDGWGRLCFRPGWTIRKLNAQGVKAWLKEPMGDLKTHYAELSKIQIESLSQIHPSVWPSSQGSSQKIELEITLKFSGGFLVNDASRTKKKDDEEEKPNHVPLRDAHGRAFLPASAFRGSLRAQAERILRTLGKKTCEGGVCQVKKNVKEEGSEWNGVCLACKVFGAPGWRSPIEVSDFIQSHDPAAQVEKQEFIAIDRFTGGGANHLKFNAQRALKPVLTGTLRVDLARLKQTENVAEALGLLALLVRDLIEGDISFGFGASKGYGSLERAEVTKISMGKPETAFKETKDAIGAWVKSLSEKKESSQQKGENP